MADSDDSLWIERSVSSVRPDAIDHALAQLWREIEVELDGQLSHAVTCNLVAITSVDDSERLAAEMRRLESRHRVRAFVLVLDHTTSELELEISGRAHRVHRGGDNVREQILMRCPPAERARTLNIIRARLVVDVPTHLYWSIGLDEDGWLLANLAQIADHAIVASGRFDDPQLAGDRLTANFGPRWCDLAEFRTRPWRRALAEAFEHFAWSPEVPTAIRIEHADRNSCHAASLLLQRWLQQKLGATVTVRAIDAELPEFGEPTRVTLDHGAYHVELVRVDAQSRIAVSVSSAPDQRLAEFTVLPSASMTGDLLAAAIDNY